MNKLGVLDWSSNIHIMLSPEQQNHSLSQSDIAHKMKKYNLSCFDLGFADQEEFILKSQKLLHKEMHDFVSGTEKSPCSTSVGVGLTQPRGVKHTHTVPAPFSHTQKALRLKSRLSQLLKWVLRFVCWCCC